jgi:hypothetical protein
MTHSAQGPFVSAHSVVCSDYTRGSAKRGRPSPHRGSLARAQAAREVLLYDPLTDGELLLSYVTDPPEGLERVRRGRQSKSGPCLISPDLAWEIIAFAE